MKLSRELKFYHAHLIELLGQPGENEGKYIAIKGGEAAGLFKDYESALEGAYSRFGIGRFLVKRLERRETILKFSRNLR